jgi:UDP-2,3-diacylglucosamine hydrolase
MQLTNNKKIYFASAFGAPTAELSLPREKRFVAWLDEVKKMPKDFSVRDLFDFGLNIKLLFQRDLFVF